MKYILNSPTDGHRIWDESININLKSYVDQPIINNGKCNSISQNNSWTISSKEFNQNISRDSLSLLPIRLQYAYFRSLSNENKLRIYKEKIKLIIENYNLSQPEKEHLISLSKFFKPEYYEENYANFVESYYNNWKNIAMHNFNWQLDKIISNSDIFITIDLF